MTDQSKDIISTNLFNIFKKQPTLAGKLSENLKDVFSKDNPKFISENNMHSDNTDKFFKIDNCKDNLSAKNKRKEKIINIDLIKQESKIDFDKRSLNSIKTNYDLSNLDVLSKKGLNRKRRKILNAEFDFSFSSKRSPDDVIIRVEFSTNKEDFNQFFNDLQKLV